MNSSQPANITTAVTTIGEAQELLEAHITSFNLLDKESFDTLTAERCYALVDEAFRLHRDVVRMSCTPTGTGGLVTEREVAHALRGLIGEALDLAWMCDK